LAGDPLDLGGAVKTLAAHPDGRQWAAVVSVEVGGELVLGVAAEQGLTVVRRFGADGRHPQALAFSPDGTLLFVGNADSTITVYGAE
ncbi:MAG: hypothetical protein NTW87_23675, partial [Planctomycetota bacterium]|nr:hypothetical protein [Planctomycetota bacterium]